MRIAIKPQPLNQALVALAVKANISIATPRDLGGLQAPAVDGRMGVDEALNALLKGSGFTYRRIDSATFAIVHAPQEFEAQAAADIVVTASLQPRSLDNAPGSISVISGDDIARNRLDGAESVSASTAGMIVTNLGPGRNKIFLRGLSDGVFSGRTQSTIGVYLDDVRIAYGAPDPDLSLADVASVEILRGPQGVRYGAGAEGGIYRLVANKPDSERYEASLETTMMSVEDGARDVSYDVMANAPILNGRGAVRGVYYRDVAPGWLDNPGLGLHNSNRTRREGGRASASLDLTPAWSLQIQGVTQRIDSADSQYLSAAAPEQIRTTRVKEPHDNDFSLGSVVIKGPLPFAELTSTSAVVAHEIGSLYDASGGLTAFGVPLNNRATLATDNRIQFYSQEFKLRGAASRFPWALGAYAAYGETDASDAGRDLDADALAYTHVRHDKADDFSIFGEITYPLIDALNVTLGARWFSTKLQTKATTERALLGVTDTFKGRRSQSDLSPRLEVSYRANPDAFYYFQASEGYRTGGLNTGGFSTAQYNGASQPFRAYSGDELWNFELGAKQKFWNGRLSLRTALFSEQWKRVQSDQLLVDGLPFTGNAGDARVYGIETEGSASFTANLTMHFALSLSESEISKADPTFSAPPGSALPGAPHVNASAQFIYVRPVTERLTAEFQLRGRYVGPSNITFADDRRTDVGDYAQVDLRAGVSAGDWSISGFADNLFDEGGATFSYGNPLRFGAQALVTPLTPRTIGLTFRKTLRDW